MKRSNSNAPFEQSGARAKKAPSSNLKAQFTQAIMKCCKFGESKHEMKKGTEDGGNGYMPSAPEVFSDNHKNGLKTFAKQMAKFMRNNYPDVKEVIRIKIRHWNEFLEVKSITCSSETLTLYCSYVRKMELIIEEHYKPKYPLNWKKRLIQPDSLKTPSGELLRVQSMCPMHFDKIMKYSKRDGTWSRAPISWHLSRFLGLRVAEAESMRLKNIHLDKPGRWGFGTADIVGKGKRFREINIKSQECRDFLIKIIESDNLKPEDKIVGIGKEHINKHLRRAMTHLNLKREFYPYTSTHSIRKLYSQETFRWLIKEQNFSETQAMQHVNNQLGHSDERDPELTAIYVFDIKRELERKKAEKAKRK